MGKGCPPCTQCSDNPLASKAFPAALSNTQMLFVCEEELKDFCYGTQNEVRQRRDQAASPRVGSRFRLPTHGGEPEEHVEWDPSGGAVQVENAVYPAPESAWFQPLNPEVMNPEVKNCFQLYQAFAFNAATCTATKRRDVPHRVVRIIGPGPRRVDAPARRARPGAGGAQHRQHYAAAAAVEPSDDAGRRRRLRQPRQQSAVDAGR
jgi:hypothetical protein